MHLIAAAAAAAATTVIIAGREITLLTTVAAEIVKVALVAPWISLESSLFSWPFLRKFIRQRVYPYVASDTVLVSVVVVVVVAAVAAAAAIYWK